MKVNPNYLTAFCCHVRFCLLSLYTVTVKISTLIFNPIYVYHSIKCKDITNNKCFHTESVLAPPLLYCILTFYPAKDIGRSQCP